MRGLLMKTGGLCSGPSHIHEPNGHIVIFMNKLDVQKHQRQQIECGLQRIHWQHCFPFHRLIYLLLSPLGETGAQRAPSSSLSELQSPLRETGAQRAPSSSLSELQSL